MWLLYQGMRAEFLSMVNLKRLESLNSKKKKPFRLNFLGGFTPFGYKDKVFIESVDGINKVVKTVDRVGYESTMVKDSDIVSKSCFR